MTKTDQNPINNIHEKGKPPKTRDEISYPHKLTGRVFTYDPIRGQGFMRVEDPGIKCDVHFLFRLLPEDTRDKLKEACKPIGKKVRKNLSPEEFKRHMRNVKSVIKDRRFRFDARVGGHGKMIIKRGSMEELR